MARFAVAYAICTDNDLSVEVVEADNWFDAVWKHSKLFSEGLDEFKESLKDSDLEGLKQAMFDADVLIDVVKID